MKAQSKDYIALQNIYKAKARQDVDEVAEHVRATELELQKEFRVDGKEIEAFCKGAAFVKLIKGRPILFTTDHIPAKRAKSIYQELKNEESMLTIHLAFMAYDSSLLSLSNGKVGSPLDDTAEILKSLEASAQAVISKLAYTADDDNEEQANEVMTKVRPILQELSRADGAELHNISALTGGMVAQEIIKVLTKQYIPIDNTCIFDGIVSKSASFRI